ncbi:hypothetical protein GNY06_11955 [Elizabethkingia argentiflava]|uniref:Uncharacterized protein n=1 Tax=Elizabethkingia argenteiflava TaxID=2681556 RepID=A0A845Q148_9FLAO|nr:hypothetical protein [Elizabethkingia argenteiflava]NAW52050.1 hypothetical protein [Elizabethkingia argenteiflava]
MTRGKPDLKARAVLIPVTDHTKRPSPISFPRPIQKHTSGIKSVTFAYYFVCRDRKKSPPAGGTDLLMRIS